tara:strand:+ start:600 stop:743 length:144 start_codon:yes stop_codon:yes gene_type:complete
MQGFINRVAEQEKKTERWSSGTTLSGFSQAFRVSADFALWEEFQPNP